MAGLDSQNSQTVGFGARFQLQSRRNDTGPAQHCGVRLFLWHVSLLEPSNKERDHRNRLSARLAR